MPAEIALFSSPEHLQALGHLPFLLFRFLAATSDTSHMEKQTRLEQTGLTMEEQDAMTIEASHLLLDEGYYYMHNDMQDDDDMEHDDDLEDDNDMED